MTPEIKSVEFSVLALEAKLGAPTEETLKMKKYLSDVLVIADPKIISDILQAIEQRVQEITTEIGVRDTDPGSEP